MTIPAQSEWSFVSTGIAILVAPENAGKMVIFDHDTKFSEKSVLTTTTASAGHGSLPRVDLE